MTLRWMLHRITHWKRTYLLLGILLLCFLIAGGVTRSRNDVPQEDLSILNIAFCMDFSTVQDFLDWYHPWQFSWLVSAGDMILFLPFLTLLFPPLSSPELTVPVIMGQRRSSILFSGLVCYDLSILVLWLSYLLCGWIVGHIPLSLPLPASYYFRTIGLSLLYYLGYGNLCLGAFLLVRSRAVGVLLGIAALLVLSVLHRLGFFYPVLDAISNVSGDRLLNWKWAWEFQPPAFELTVLILFPLVTTLLCCLIGVFRLRRRDLV